VSNAGAPPAPMRIAARYGLQYSKREQCRNAAGGVDCINAHGISKAFDDRFETLIIKKVFGDHARKLAASPTQSMTGRLLGAAGGIESSHVKAHAHVAGTKGDSRAMGRAKGRLNGKHNRVRLRTESRSASLSWRVPLRITRRLGR
jgi:hypothetical protein